MIQTKRCELRLASLSDAQFIVDFYIRNKEHLAPWDPPAPDDFYTIEYWEKKIRDYQQEFENDQSLRLFIFEKEENTLIGNINFTTFERGPFQNCRVGYKIDIDYEGKGYMYEAFSAACDYIFQKLKFHRIEASYIPTNFRSGNLLKKMGFEEHGIAKYYLFIAGEWQDHVLTSLVYPSDGFVIDDPIEIVEYKSEWHEQFLRIKKILSVALKGFVLSIDHIGSTSVPALAAKDRIDVQVTVENLSDEFKISFDKALIKAGFRKSLNYSDHRPPGDESSEDNWKKFYIAGGHPECNFTMNIHVRALGKENQKYPLLFRDFLRTHPESAMAYAQLKRELARFHPNDREAYCEIKDPGCDLIMVHAKEWAKNIGWSIEQSMDDKS